MMRSSKRDLHPTMARNLAFHIDGCLELLAMYESDVIEAQSRPSGKVEVEIARVPQQHLGASNARIPVRTLLLVLKHEEVGLACIISDSTRPSCHGYP